MNEMMFRRSFRRWWPGITFFGICIFLFWKSYKHNNLQVPTEDGWIAVRLSQNQEEYVDRRGVHVVVGHYTGDTSSDRHPPNLTEELLNTNMFDPKPSEGKDGTPVLMPPHLNAKVQQLYHINRFNLMASDRIPLNRTLPDVRKKRCRLKTIDIRGLPKASVIIVFHNEAWSTLLRTVHSVIDRSPSSLLQEVLLVDDASTRKFLGKELDDYVAKLPVPTRVLRTGKRDGLIRARLMGARAAQGQILTFLDAHCECTIGWLENLIERVAENRKRVVCPVIDIISDDTFAYIRSFELHWGAFNWEMHFRWYTLDARELAKRRKDITQPFSTPAMAGGLFAMDKNFFFELGSYDDRMEVWGGENLEMSFRVWQCGGSVEIAPCSHVGHLFRKSSPYSFPGGVSETLFANLARVALVWMDEWKEFYFKFTPEAEKVRDRQAIRDRLQLRSQLQCHSFQWYLDNVWPQHFFPTDKRFFGRIKHRIRGECLEKPNRKGSLNQPMGPARLGHCVEPAALRQMFVMDRTAITDTDTGTGTDTGAPLMTDESVCLDAPPKEGASTAVLKVKVIACTGHARQAWTYNQQSGALRHVSSGLCLDLPQEGDEGLALAACNTYPSQQWTLESVPWK
ncbi:polypeptide N-acetylgalactosaminyltransferase 13 isoform X2 [Nilaparvata lugens]|uniref:polypeptide N-acetylgalactosaminyltransferase 13 isoform X1 n=1 Tax=Nilaparvata lugens TaxID=108931 RepID=UPI000B9801A2|nr:polypeptide N-acetylgalactosaminyltransferase 13 isoform X1 [Nilaparvata lugens]XP_039284799.1 polypeptide N-acetylgalactosaminyltransferase 13 isoform X2 [Nilaparvata lugens]